MSAERNSMEVVPEEPVLPESDLWEHREEESEDKGVEGERPSRELKAQGSREEGSPDREEVKEDPPRLPSQKKTRAPAEKFPCGKCGRLYSLRRLDDHKCVPPTFLQEQRGDEDKENQRPETPPGEETSSLPKPPGEETKVSCAKASCASTGTGSLPPPKTPPKPHFDLDSLTPDVISSMIRKDREEKRAARRERWASQLF